MQKERKKERKKALRYLMFLRRHEMGLSKHMDVPMQELSGNAKYEMSPPTITLEAIMLSCAMDAKEGRYVVVTEIPGASLHADR